MQYEEALKAWQAQRPRGDVACTDAFQKGYAAACAHPEILRAALEPTKAEKQLRELLVNNGRNAANNREGIKVGSPLHLAEMMLIQIEQARKGLGS